MGKKLVQMVVLPKEFVQALVEYIEYNNAHKHPASDQPVPCVYCDRFRGTLVKVLGKRSQKGKEDDYHYL